MRTSKRIYYNWDIDFKLSQEEKDKLKEDAESRMFEMMQQGYYSGELHTYVGEKPVYGSWHVDTIINDEKNAFNELIFQLRYYKNRIQDLIEDMPYKGDKQEDSQKVCLMSAIMNLEQTINGTEKQDLEL